MEINSEQVLPRQDYSFSKNEFEKAEYSEGKKSDISRKKLESHKSQVRLSFKDLFFSPKNSPQLGVRNKNPDFLTSQNDVLAINEEKRGLSVQKFETTSLHQSDLENDKSLDDSIDNTKITYHDDEKIFLHYPNFMYWGVS